jgi:hypothetical protein
MHSFQHVANGDPELFIEHQIQITAAVYKIHEANVSFNTQFGNILYVTKRFRNNKVSHRRWQQTACEQEVSVLMVLL